MTRRQSIFEQFILHFLALKNAAGDNPQRFVNFYDQSPSLKEACSNFEGFMFRTDFERRVFHGSAKYFPQVPPTFEREWKEYENRWASAIAHVFLKDLGVDTGDYTPIVKSDIKFEVPDPERDTHFDPCHHDGGKAIDMALWATENYASDVGTEFEDDIHRASKIGLGAHDYLQNTIGLKLPEVFRRWQTVPIVFMPTHVSNKHGLDEKGSLYNLLDDAVRAYVAGAPAAAIAMCRAALEMVLKQHYKLPYHRSEGGRLKDKGLAEIISLASERYDFVDGNRILPLKERADEIMHSYSKTKKLTQEDERTIVQFLKTVKFLIQRAPV